MTPTDLLPLPLWEGVGGRGPAARCPDAPPTPAQPPAAQRQPARQSQPRLALRRQKPRRLPLPSPGHAQRPLPPARRQIHRPAHAQGHRPHVHRQHQTRPPVGTQAHPTALRHDGHPARPPDRRRKTPPALPAQADGCPPRRRPAGALATSPPHQSAICAKSRTNPGTRKPGPSPTRRAPSPQRRTSPPARPRRRAARSPSLAPWREAIAIARATKRAALAANRTAYATRRVELAAKRTARQAKQTASASSRTARQATRTARVPAAPATRPPVLDQFPDQYSLLQRELAARKVGLRARISEPHQPAAADAPKPNSMFSRIYPMNPDPAAGPRQNPIPRFPESTS
jgi:hypothetical protein